MNTSAAWNSTDARYQKYIEIGFWRDTLAAFQYCKFSLTQQETEELVKQLTATLQAKAMPKAVETVDATDETTVTE